MLLSLTLLTVKMLRPTSDKCARKYFGKYLGGKGLKNIGLTIPGKWSFVVDFIVKSTKPIRFYVKSGRFHVKSGRFHEIHLKTLK